MSHEFSTPRPSRHEARRKKRKLSTKQKLMGAGATVATGVALFSAGVLSGGNGGQKVNTQQGLERVDLSKAEHGAERFKQILDPNEQGRFVSEGVDAPTPEAALDKLFNAMGHDYRILDVYAKLSGAYEAFGLPPKDFNYPGNAELLLSDDSKSLSPEGQQILELVKANLAGEAGERPGWDIQFVDLEDEIMNNNWGPLSMTGMDKSGFVRNSVSDTFGSDTKAVWIHFPAVGDMHNEGGWASLTFAVSGGQPVLEGYSQTDSVPEGLTEAQGHQPIEPVDSETGGY